MLTEALSWREEFDVDQTVNFPEAFGKLGYVHGKDKAGRPVTCVLILSFKLMSTRRCFKTGFVAGIICTTQTKI